MQNIVDFDPGPFISYISFPLDLYYCNDACFLIQTVRHWNSLEYRLYGYL